MGTKITLSTLPFSQHIYQSLFNALSVFQFVFLFCFTLARTNHLLWTDPEVEPDGGPEVEPDGGPDVAASLGGHLDLDVTVTAPNR